MRCNRPAGWARGIAVVGGDVSDDALEAMDEAGVRGVRFNFLRRLVDSAPRDVFLRIAERIAKLGWHVVVYFEAPDMEDLTPFLKSLPTTVVIDHMGRPDVSKRSTVPASRPSSACWTTIRTSGPR